MTIKTGLIAPALAAIFITASPFGGAASAAIGHFGNQANQGGFGNQVNQGGAGNQPDRGRSGFHSFGNHRYGYGSWWW